MITYFCAYFNRFFWTLSETRFKYDAIMRKFGIKKKHLGVLTLSYASGCLLMMLAHQASATSYVPLPERKPYETGSAKDSRLLMKTSFTGDQTAAPDENVITPPPKPETETTSNQGVTPLPAPKPLGAKTGAASNNIDPALEDAPSPAQETLDFLARAIAMMKMNQKTDNAIKTKMIDTPGIIPVEKPEIAEDITIFRPIPASEAPYPEKKPISDSMTLSEKDSELYKQIFAHQAVANWRKADKLIGQLDDFRLRGHVLFQRYMHPTSYTTSFEELNGWMNAYADLPGADRIYKLALAKMPADFKGAIRKPEAKSYRRTLLAPFRDNSKYYRSQRKRSTQQNKDIANLQSKIRRYIAKGAPTMALKTLDQSSATKILDAVEHDRLKAKIANSYMLVGKLDDAMKLAVSAANRSGIKAPQAGWVGGLIAWRHRDYKMAAKLFAQTAKSPYSSSWSQSAGAYWVSRAEMRAGNIRDVSSWLQLAAQNPRTFYGMIATKALGWDPDFDWRVPDLNQNDIDLLAKTKAGWRALALVASGQQHLAEAELKQLDIHSNPDIVEALLAYSVHEELPSFALKIAETTERPNGGLYDAALYPLSPWEPQHKSGIDRAMIHALIRQESRFNPYAESRSGATGLMQLMPGTASFVSGNKKYKTREGQHSLKNPQINLEIGEKYVRSLLRQGSVDNELFSMVIAYNAGPGNLRRWQKDLEDISDDPLLFIESIPMAETRAFVEHVMAFYWIYRMRLDQPTPSLQAVAEGSWPKYVMMDGNKAHQKTASAEQAVPRRRIPPYQQ